MGKRILITGKDTFLGNEIIRELQAGDHQLISTVNPRPDGKVQWEVPEKHLVVPWNRRTSLGAQNLILEAKKKFGGVDEAWLVYSPEMDSRPAEDVSNLDLEERLDQGLKGFFFLVRELGSLSQEGRKPELNFVLFHEQPASAGPLSSCLYGGFAGLAQGTIQTARGLRARGFESAGNSAEAFLQYLRDQGFSGKAPWGKWHVYQEKRGFFSGNKGGLL